MKFEKKNARKAYKAPAIVYTGKVGTRAGTDPSEGLNDVFGD